MTCRHSPYDCTYTKTYVACSACHQRWEWSDRYGWQPNPRIGKGRFER